MAVEEERALVGVAGDATPDFLAVDFFCGAGGTTRGLIDANGYVIAGVDKDARCDDTYVRNNVNTKIDGKAPAFLHRDIFPSTAAYPDGEQGRLYKELSELADPTNGLDFTYVLDKPRELGRYYDHQVDQVANSDLEVHGGPEAA